MAAQRPASSKSTLITRIMDNLRTFASLISRSRLSIHFKLRHYRGTARNKAATNRTSFLGIVETTARRSPLNFLCIILPSTPPPIQKSAPLKHLHLHHTPINWQMVSCKFTASFGEWYNGMSITHRASSIF